MLPMSTVRCGAPASPGDSSACGPQNDGQAGRQDDGVGTTSIVPVAYAAGVAASSGWPLAVTVCRRAVAFATTLAGSGA